MHINERNILQYSMQRNRKKNISLIFQNYVFHLTSIQGFLYPLISSTITFYVFLLILGRI